MPEQLGKYELLTRIGVGGMAEVFVARTRGAEGFVKQVVIKRILPAYSQDPRFVQMFINEAHLAARLQHANVVQIFDFDHLGDTYYIAMEWIDGADLRRTQSAAERRRMPVPTTMATHVGVEALKGLHYAHTKTDQGRPLGIVHRDISPHNLLVSFAGEVKIADFGIAKAASLLSATRTGVVKGKLPYMAPEQVAAGQVDARTDIFALGIVLWELVARRRLHAGCASEGELLGRVRRCEIPPVRAVQPDVPRELEAVLQRMLAPAPEARYQSAAEALAELSRLGGVGDALEVADYLRRLLPAEAARDLRGRTVLERADYREAPPGAETRTRLSSPRPVAPPAAERAQRSERASQAPPPERRSGAGAGAGAAAQLDARPSRRWAYVVAAAVVALLGGAGGWRLAAPDPPTVPPGATAIVITDPPAARLWIDGWSVEHSGALEVGGAVDTVVEARVALDRRSGSRRIRFAAGAQRVTLRLVDPGQGAASTRRGAEPQRGDGGTRGAIAADAQPHQRRAAPADPTRAAPSRRGARRRGWGTLNVIVEPWAHVTVDGRDLGTTPLRDHRIAAGGHRVELSNPELGRQEKLRISSEAGKTATIRRRWLR